MRGFVGLLRSSIRRDLGALVFSGVGMVFGVAALVLFLRIGMGLQEHIVEGVLGQLPAGTLQLKAEKGSSLLGFLTGNSNKGMGPVIDAAKLQKIASHPAVGAVHERLRVDFPMIAWGLQKELGLTKPMAVDVFASGLPEDWVSSDIGEGQSFTDPGKGKPIPVLLSKRLLAMANSALAATLRVDVTPKLITGLRFTVMLGRSYMTGTKNDKRARQVIMQIVGVSEHATTLGFSVPAATAMRWNAEFGRPQRPVEAAWVELSSPKRLSEVVDQARALGLAVDDSQRMIAAALDGVLAMLLLVAGLLLGLAAMIIGQTFFTRVALRRGEYALYRALGARRSTLIAVVLSEAAGVGLVCGVLGLSIGNLVGGWLEAKALLVAAELPFAPDALLSDPGFASLIGLSVAVGFAILGALRPAVGAASADPAVALGL
jgi:hypothetical protein